MLIKSLILDWAGTIIDHGSLTPVYAMQMAFEEFQLYPSTNIIRKYMGLHKLKHIQSILSDADMNLISSIKSQKHLDELSHQIFEKLVFTTQIVAQDRSKPINGAVEFIEYFKSKGVKIGSTTGYTFEMMRYIIPIAKKYGVNLDSVVTPDEVPAGRPYPWMVYKNCINLASYPLWQMIKVGDTIADIQEGLNAGMWVIALTKCGNELGMSEEEINSVPEELLNEKKKKAEEIFLKNGAHYVANSLSDTYEFIDEINEKIKHKILPNV